MTEARLSVQFAGALVTLQDAGRTGHLRYGVPASGPMDKLAFAAAHAALGNSPDQSAIEISLGGLILECTTGAVTVAVAGGDFAIEHAGVKGSGWTILTLQQGERLSVRVGKSGSWAYLAFAGDLQANEWLGHTATHSISGFGGGAVVSEQELLINNAEVRKEREGNIETPGFLIAQKKLSQTEKIDSIRVVMGPQDKWFRSEAIDAFKNSSYQLTDSYDRMGVRLQGPDLPLDAALSIPSEPLLRGSVQVSGENVPTILLADHGTTGGYPKIATVISPDINTLVQLRSRQAIKFVPITAAEAVDVTRDFSTKLKEYIAKIAIPRGNLQQRLMQENLISGIYNPE